MWAEVLGTVEPAIDELENNYQLFDKKELEAVNNICETLNVTAKYIPGVTKLSQNTSVQNEQKERFQDSTSILTLYSILRESKTVLSYLNNVANYIAALLPEARVAKKASVLPISKCLETTFMDLAGIYSGLHDVTSVIVHVPRMALLRDCLEIIETVGISGRNRLAPTKAPLKKLGVSDSSDVASGTPAQRWHLLLRPDACTPFSVVAVRNKFQLGYDARENSCGFRDCSVYITLLNSPHPKHVAVLRFEVHRLESFGPMSSLGKTTTESRSSPTMYSETESVSTAVSNSSGPAHSNHNNISSPGDAINSPSAPCNSDHWAYKLFHAAKPLKIFEEALRRHVGPVEPVDADRIRDGLCNVVNMDSFPLKLYGGKLLISAIRESPYCSLQVIIVYG